MASRDSRSERGGSGEIEKEEDDGASSVSDGNNATSQAVAQGQSQGPNQTNSEELLECPICLQPIHMPVELPCGHIFCFLCIKGVAMQGPNGRCAICRSNIPHYVLTNPRLKDISQLYKDPKSCTGYQWFYESRGGGWWQYDERTMQELERAYESGQPSCQLLIAGHLYEIDFPQMIQYRANNRNLFRRIKRDVPTAEKRGIAGIRLNNGGPGTGGSNDGGSNNTNPTSGRRRRGASSYPSNSSNSSAAPASTNVTTTSSSTAVDTCGNSPASNGNGRSNCDAAQAPLRGQRPFDEEVMVGSDSSEDGENERDDEEDSDYLDDDDMELGEEEEALIGDDTDEDEDEETEDDEEDDTRDGARAPTRRSDRSNSSSNQTPPPPPPPPTSNGNGTTCNSNSNGRGRGVRGSRGRSNNSSRNHTDSASPISDGSTFAINSTRSIQISPVMTNTSPNNNHQGNNSTSTTTTGLTCILIGPGVRITVDHDNANRDEIL